MAFGLSPKYNKNIPIGDLSPKQFLVLSIEAVKKLNWNIEYMTDIGFTSFTKISMGSWSEEIKVIIEGDIAKIQSVCIGKQLIDWGKNKINIEILIETINELKVEYTIDDLENKVELLETNLLANKLDNTNQSKEIETTKPISIFSFFIPKKDYFITPIIVNINIIIFIIMICYGVDFMSPTSESIISWGANFKPITLEGEWWRLVSNFFLHIGIFHLLFNMYALVYIGNLLEPHLGKIRFLTAYLLSGLLASVTSLWWHELTISAGASGAIFGMYGVFLVFLTTNLIERNTRKALLTSIGIFVLYNLINGIKDGIDNAAHIGGLFGGIIIGYIYSYNLDEDEIEARTSQLKISGLLTFCFLGISFMVCSNMRNDIQEYETKMKEFHDMEKMALEVYSQSFNKSKEDILYSIRDRGIYYWNENINLTDQIEKLKLPEDIHKRNLKIKKYCQLRIESYWLLYKTVEEDTQKYKDEIEAYNIKIQSLSDEISFQ